MMEDLKVTGVNCMHCIASIKGALEGVEGVGDIDPKLDEKAALVSFDPGKISKEQVAARIEDIGFDVE